MYCSIDPATCILEAAVHRGFTVLDTKPHVLTSVMLEEPAVPYVVDPQEVPNPAWLQGGVPSAGQQAFGARLLQDHAFVAFPSVVSRMSWNLVFSPLLARDRYRQLAQTKLVLDTRLSPPA